MAPSDDVRNHIQAINHVAQCTVSIQYYYAAIATTSSEWNTPPPSGIFNFGG